MHSKFGYERKYKATKNASPDIAMESVWSSVKKSNQTFEKLRNNTRLFNCIKNDIVSNDPDYFESNEYNEVVDLWQQFYKSEFPMRSKFELADGERNECMHIDECRNYDHHNVMFSIINLCIYVVIILCVVFLILEWTNRNNSDPGFNTHKITFENMVTDEADNLAWDTATNIIKVHDK